MLRLTVFLSCLLVVSSLSFAEDSPPTLHVWPGKAPGAVQDVQEKWDKKKVTNVTQPTLEIFRGSSLPLGWTRRGCWWRPSNGPRTKARTR